MIRRSFRVFAATGVALVAVATLACSSKVENFELSSYDLPAGTSEYTVEFQVTGNAELGAIETLLGSSSSGEGNNVDFTLKADATLEVAKEGANNVLTLTLSNFDGKLPFGADYPNDKETYEMTVDPQGEVVSSSTDGLLTVIPGVAGTFGFNCPPLPDEPTQGGASWTSDYTPPFSGKDDEAWESENRWKDTEVEGQQAAEITSNVNQDFSSTVALGEIVGLLGVEGEALRGVTATAEGSLSLASTCALSIPDQELLSSSGTNKVDIAFSVDAGEGVTGDISRLISDVTLDLTIEGTMSPR